MNKPSHERRHRRPIAVAVVVLAGMLAGGCGLADAIDAAAKQKTGSEKQEKSQKTLVVHVVDGDTVELANGEHVRLIGIDAPEDGACGAVAATKKLTRLVEGRRVALVRGGDNRDRYDRLLRYVDRGAADAGLVMIQSGLAIARYDSRDGYGEHPRERAYLTADRKAANVECTAPPAPPKPKPPVPPKPKPKPKPPKASSTRRRTVLPATRRAFPTIRRTSTAPTPGRSP